MDGTATLNQSVEDVTAPPTPKPRRQPTTPKPRKTQRSPAPAAPERPQRAQKAPVFDPETYETVPPWLAGHDDVPHWSHFPEPDPAAPKPEPAPQSEAAEPKAAPRKPLTQSEAIQELTRRANAGSKSALDALRKLLDQHPEMLQSVGDLGKFAERAWVELIAEGNKLVEEATTRRLASLKAQLAGTSPSTLETLVTDLVAINWLAVQEGLMAAAREPGKNLPLATYRLRRAESAQRRFASATRSLATLRALLPAESSPPRARNKT